MKTTPLRLLATAALCAVSSVHAQILFQDNFDGAPYTNNAPLVTGAGNLDHGIWSLNNSGSGTAITSTEAALSASRSLALSRGSAAGTAQVVGTFSETGTTPQIITDGLSLQFSFMMKDSTFDSWFYLQGSDGRTALVKLGSSVSAAHNDVYSDVATGLSANTWYTLELIMPTISTSPNNYTVNLYDSMTSAELGSSTGLFQGVGTDYQFFTIYNSVQNSTLFIDNVSVVPEPGTSVLLLLGGVGLWLAHRRTRR